MATLETATVRVSIDAAFDDVVRDLAEPLAHAEWATEFFAGPAEPLGDGEVRVNVPRMGGPVRFRIGAQPEVGVIDLYLAPEGGAFGPPLPVRVLRNGDGVDVLFTLTRFPGMPAEVWRDGVASMERELGALKRRHESVVRATA